MDLFLQNFAKTILQIAKSRSRDFESVGNFLSHEKSRVHWWFYTEFDFLSLISSKTLSGEIRNSSSPKPCNQEKPYQNDRKEPSFRVLITQSSSILALFAAPIGSGELGQFRWSKTVFVILTICFCKFLQKQFLQFTKSLILGWKSSSDEPISRWRS